VTLRAEFRAIAWELREPFTISRGTMHTADAVLVTLTDANGNVGRGEAYGIPYEGETPQSILAQLERFRARIEDGLSRTDAQSLLPHGGARCGLDLALWDLEARQTGVRAWQRARIEAPRAVTTAFTIGMRSLEATARRAGELRHLPVLKIKVDAREPLAVIRSVHAASPMARLIVDPNQSWSLALLRELAPQLADLNVVLLEQPLPVGGDDGLEDYDCPLPVCADEVIHDLADLPRAIGRYDVVNIKLDKSGGLTEALALAHAALAADLRLMVGCMAGSSLAMAPAAIVAQLCDFVDLDGPLLQKDDWPHALEYANGRMSFPDPALWG
jgi:L-alanine-DL-glutamate epimerase-like enolase superfamily enzyme